MRVISIRDNGVRIAESHSDIAQKMLQRMVGQHVWEHKHMDYDNLMHGFRPDQRGMAAEVADELLREGILLYKAPGTYGKQVALNIDMQVAIGAIVNGDFEIKVRPPHERSAENNGNEATVRNEPEVQPNVKREAAPARAQIAFEKISDTDIIELLRDSTISEVKMLFPKQQRGKSLDQRLRKLTNIITEEGRREDRWLHAEIEKDMREAREAAKEKYIDAEFGEDGRHLLEQRQAGRFRRFIDAIRRH